jgi:hypothetical protein
MPKGKDVGRVEVLARSVVDINTEIDISRISSLKKKHQ